MRKLGLWLLVLVFLLSAAILPTGTWNVAYAETENPTDEYAEDASQADIDADSALDQTALQAQYTPQLDDNRNWVNMILRARQLKEIYWYCLQEMDGGHPANGEAYGSFLAGKGYFGIPYGMGMRYVFNEKTSFNAFLADTRNKGSLFYSKSFKKDGYVSLQWGADCSSFVAYAWDLDKRLSTAELVNLTVSGAKVKRVVRRGEGKIRSVYDLNQIVPGDALVFNSDGGHARLVVSVTRENHADPYDTTANVIGMIVWEQINMTASSYIATTTYGLGGLQPRGNEPATQAIGVFASLEDLVNDIQNDTPDEPLDDYGVYRLKNFQSSRSAISYTPNPAVPLSLEEALNGNPFLGTPQLMGYRVMNAVYFVAVLDAVPLGGEELVFILERSTDGTLFTEVAYGVCKSDAGEGLAPLTCFLRDWSAQSDVSYQYRVRAQFAPQVVDFGSTENDRGMLTTYMQYSGWSDIFTLSP